MTGDSACFSKPPGPTDIQLLTYSENLLRFPFDELPDSEAQDADNNCQLQVAEPYQHELTCQNALL
jgi:hypothetical protein